MRIAFFWTGADIAVPQALVHSIRLVQANCVEILQLSDPVTPVIDGVDRILRSELSRDIMIARLQAYSRVKISEEFTFFCDADSIFVNPLAITSDRDVLLSPREVDFMINADWPEPYPEFRGRMIGEVMPYLFGAIAVRRNAVFFPQLLEICESLPARFHRWYGDQVALALAVKKGNVEFGLLAPDIFLKIMTAAPSAAQLAETYRQGTQMITFKGHAAEKLGNLKLTLARLRSIRETSPSILGARG